MTPVELLHLLRLNRATLPLVISRIVAEFGDPATLTHRPHHDSSVTCTARRATFGCILRRSLNRPLISSPGISVLKSVSKIHFPCLVNRSNLYIVIMHSLVRTKLAWKGT